jgi:GNAT superfamily N-acetyltransferase
MNPQPIIRPVLAADLPAWTALWEGYNAFYGRKDQTALSEEITRTTWSRLLEPDEPVHALVAESEGRLLGLAHFLFHRSTIQLGPVCYMQDLFTVAAARGKGVGRALIEAVYRRARDAGAARVYWQTHEANVAAMRLYDQVAERSGFMVYRRVF